MSAKVRGVIQENCRGVIGRIADAALRTGRAPEKVRLVAVTKYAELDWVQALVDLGGKDLGENRPQQLLERAAQVHVPEGSPEVRWHLIGHLQRNKVRKLLPTATLVHSVDSLRLLTEIDRQAAELDLRPRVLLEVNLIDDPHKHGFRREELVRSWPEISMSRRVSIEGLMAMAAETSDPETARPTFAALRTLRDELATPEQPLPELSMGMTGDFEIAVEEGATLVRIGSALWNGLPVA